MSNDHADRIQHWLSEAEDQDTEEKKLAARYTAAASARLWVLARLDDESDDAPEGWTQVQQLASQADDYLDDDRQDEAMFRRAQANLLALRLFEDSDGKSDDGGTTADDDEADDDTEDGSQDRSA
jgi:hypothetical protein